MKSLKMAVGLSNCFMLTHLSEEIWCVCILKCKKIDTKYLQASILRPPPPSKVAEQA